MAHRMVSVETKEEMKRKKFAKSLHCNTLENQLEPLKRDIHTICSRVFQSTDASDIPLVIEHRNTPSLECELIQTRLYSSFVKLRPLFSFNKRNTVYSHNHGCCTSESSK